LSARLLLAFTAAALIGCDGVPSLTFPEAGSADAGDEGDSLTDAADAPVEPCDAVGATCPTCLPAGASVCCVAVPCSGDCTPPNCSLCMGKCQAGDICCANNGNAVCHSLTTGCH
jgi:hypothetical protein